ncbi:hypothetical protein E1A91_A09G009200v1 [Gossypium mustelinum]|uniref:TCP domain-containing protein n=1 Tax=Gossypium mustelinum TaxID=34275 RepID=A0A5D2XS96_GOSMU|nr:hypothetical protein E1A91_A09G009200v1 [Gossypium mustelinum]TYJ16836.1 hypothetical protein E1A91_A09G009200v1 [Gossypium mustelinum]
MISSSKNTNFPTRQDEDDDKRNETNKGPSSSSSSSQWLRLKDPRIVRVSRAFGGKDRHSKVYTIRGLRDRRVRLSVPTAIQLYDLQDRLGLNQPSKVVDWLLNAAKHEIDELPPLPMPPPPANFPISDAFWRTKSKEVTRDVIDDKDDKHRRNEASHGFAVHAPQVDNFNVVAAPLPSALSLCPLPPPQPGGGAPPLFPPHVVDPRQQVNHFQMLSSGAPQNLLLNSLNFPPITQSFRPFQLMPPRFPHNQPDKWPK